MPENVNITVRCAFQSGTDIHVDCPTTWTVKNLKEHLHTVCSLHPAVASQRLIYAGACLADQMTIEAVLARRKFDDQLVFHLVCPMPQVAPEIRQRNTAGGVQGTLPNSCNIPTRSANQMGSPITPTSPQDYAQAYQAYYQWYMHSYMNMMATTHGTPAAFAPTWDQNAGVNMPAFWGNIGNQPLNQPQPPAPAPQENDVAARPANFVQGEEELEARGGDILDLLYRCFRIVLFVSVVWLYSSIERFLVVFCIGLGIYFLKLRRDQRAAAAAANPTTPPVNNNNTGEPMANNPDMPEVEIPQPNSRQLFLSTCYSFVTSFFTSLVPDNPVPANLN